jgi:hypothetical protein
MQKEQRPTGRHKKAITITPSKPEHSRLFSYNKKKNTIDQSIWRTHIVIVYSEQHVRNRYIGHR